MPEPVLISIAAALASRSIVGLYKLVKAKFAHDPEATAVLEAAEGAGDGSPEVKQLQDRLTAARDTDPVFAEQLRREWERGSGGVVNTISGTVSGKVVQARDIHGDISF
jgi:hypothetical protein